MPLRIGRRAVHRAQRKFAEVTLGHALGLLGKDPDRNAKVFLHAIDHIAGGRSKGSFGIGRMTGWLRTDRAVSS